MLRAFLLAATLAIAGCQADDPLIGGTVVSVMEAEGAEESETAPKYYDDPLVPEVAWRVEVRLDDGEAVTVIHNGPRRYEPGERVRLLVDTNGDLFL